MFGKTTEYAIRALVYIHLKNVEGVRPGFKEIARQIDSPEQFTAKVLQHLTRAKLISSVKGRGGGFFFDNPALPLPLFDVVKALEGEAYFHRCGFGLESCDANDPCPLHEDYSKVRESVFKLVTEKTIQSLASKINEHKAVLNRI